MLQILIERVALASRIDQVVVATTTVSEDNAIEELARQLGVGCYRGSMEDILERLLNAALAFGADDVVGLTGDNPLVDPILIDDVIEFYRSGRFDYVTTTHMHHTRKWVAERTFPVGVSVQVFSTQVLADAAARTQYPVERSHGSFAIYDHPERYRLGAFTAEGKYSAWKKPELRFTVDVPEDLVLMREIFGALYPSNPAFSTGDAIRLVDRNPRLKVLNAHVQQRIVWKEKEACG